MPRLPKWLLLKEWLTYDDVMKVFENSPTELENILARDESEEFGYSYKFTCTFAPRDCQKEIKEYRFEQTARQSMRAHLKDHIKLLKANMTADDAESEFLTRNQLFQQSKGHKHKMQVNKSEVPSKRPKSAVKSDDLSHNSKESVKEKPKLKRQRKKNQFTEIKQTSANRENIEEMASSNFKGELNDISVVTAASDEHEQNSEISELKEILASDVKQELVDLGLVAQVQEAEIDDEDFLEKISCETQTDTKKKEMETAQYRIATKLFAIDRTQWGKIEKILEEFVNLENASQEITEDDKLRIMEAMNQWMDSVMLYNRQATESLQDPLSASEESVLDSLSPEDWRRLDAADDPESKLRLTVYARMLLRDYVWYPRKFKPKVCRHCQRQYTASTSLYSHLVSLSGIRFWVCSKCKDANRDEATFTRKHSLQYHILKEVGIPRYRCSQPGCHKTHNHTHHQKSHARQHTGEQYYKCEVPGCKVRFSNRNTYSRHLLQNHSTELTSANQLRAIDRTEAQMKVYAARLRARERSKCKRQQTNECTFKEQETDKRATQDRSLTPLVVNEAQSSDNDTSSGLEKMMKPSASQLLYGIARDVRKTTSTMEEMGKPNDNMLGGLNLLATVSKYMNAENCDINVWRSEPENYNTKISLAPPTNETTSQDVFCNNNVSHSQSTFLPVNDLSESSFQSTSSLCQVINDDQTQNLSEACEFQTQMSSSMVTMPMAQMTPVSTVPCHPISVPSSAQCASSNTSPACALNMQRLRKKLILKHPPVVNAISDQVCTPSTSSTMIPVNSDVSKEQSSAGTPFWQVSKEGHQSSSSLQSGELESHESSSKAAMLTACDKNETIDTPGTVATVPETKSDSAIQQKVVNSNSQLHLRSISCVSGKTYIILASPPKTNFVHNRQPCFKDSDDKTGGKIVVGTAISLT